MVNGNNFDPNATLSFSGNATDFAITYISKVATQIRASITIGSNAVLGARDVIVTNPNGDQATLSAAFTVLGAPPVTRTLTVASTNPNSGVAITVSPLDNGEQGKGITPFTLSYNDGVVVTLGAQATAGGNNFSSWTGCDSTPSTTCTRTMNADRTVTANYVTPLLPPSITFVSPASGNQGETIAKFIVNGMNFDPKASILSFKEDNMDFTISYDRHSSTVTQIVASVTVAPHAGFSIRDVVVTNPDTQKATLPNAFRVTKEFPIVDEGGHNIVGFEPTVAVDPRDPLHAVVAFSRCSWAESRDGGLTWTTGSLSFPSPFHVLSDPWVRFSPNGDLFYSCLGTTDKKNSGVLLQVSKVSRGVFVAVSQAPPAGSGLAKDLGIAQQLVKYDIRCTSFFTIPCDPDQGELPDHPSIGFKGKNGGPVRAVVCWVDVFHFRADEHFVQVAFSDGGGTWSKPITLDRSDNGSGNLCNVGGSDTEVGVTWWNPNSRTLKVSKSKDGANWSQPQTLANLGSLVYSYSTTSLVLDEPYALLVPGKNGLRAVWQTGGNLGQVAVGDAVANALPTSELFFDPENAILVQETNEEFLPGAGSCPRVAGAYEVTTLTKQFRYKVWPIDGPPIQPIFASGKDLDAQVATPDSRFNNLRRIGDYTGTDCLGTLGWAVWTDLRNGQTEIWVGLIPLL